MKDSSIQIAKGIGILLMVMGHSGFWPYDNPFIYMFHMPLFFFLSGYCFKEKNILAPPTSYFRKKIIGIYLPYIKWALFFLIIHNLLFYVDIYNANYGFGLYTIRDIIERATSITLKMQGEDAMVGGFWFLRCLFFSSITLFLFLKILHNKLLIFLIFTGAMLGCLYFNFHVPFWGLDKAYFMSNIFMLIGYSYRQKPFVIASNLSMIFICFLLVCVGALLWPTSMLRFNFSQSMPYIISGVAGSLMVILVSKMIELPDNTIGKTLLYIGNRTMIILALHFISFKIISLLIIYVYDLPMFRLSEFITIHEYSRKGWWIAYVIAGVSVPLLIDFAKLKLRNKYSVIKALI